MMLNQVPGSLCPKLTTPFELVHNSKPKSKTWFELLSIGYFNHDTYNTKSRSKFQSHTLDGIAVVRDDSSNSIIFYNPITSGYYFPPAFRLYESRLQITNFPNSLRFDGGIICGLLWNKTNPIHEPSPLGTRVYIQHDNVLARGTIKNIPITVSPILKCDASTSPEQSDNGSISTELIDSPPCVILLESGTTVKKIIWRPHPGWSGWCFTFQVNKQYRRPRGNSPLPPQWFQSHDGSQRGIPQSGILTTPLSLY